MPKPTSHLDTNGTEYEVKSVTDPEMWADMRRHYPHATLVQWKDENTYWFDPNEKPDGYEPHPRTGVYRKVR